MMMKRLLRGDNRGVGAVEFALIAPVLITFIVGISQLGRLFFANADMKNAVAAGARLASTWQSPNGVPSDDAIKAAINQRLVRSGARSRVNPVLTRGVDELGNPYVEIKMSYSVPLDFIFFDAPAVTLHETRRVFTQVAQNNSTTYTTTTGSSGTTGTTTGGTTTTTGGTTSTTGGTTSSTTGGTTSSTTTGGTTSTTGGTTSTSSTGGTTSTSSTSASSAGGTTSSTSASTSASSSTSSSSTTSSSGNASSTGNNGSSGHAHGDCKKC